LNTAATSKRSKLPPSSLDLISGHYRSFSGSTALNSPFDSLHAPSPSTKNFPGFETIGQKDEDLDKTKILNISFSSNPVTATENLEMISPELDSAAHERAKSCIKIDSNKEPGPVDFAMEMAMGMVQKLQAENDELKTQQNELRAQSMQAKRSQQILSSQISSLNRELRKQRLDTEIAKTSYDELYLQLKGVNVDKDRLQEELDSSVKQKDLLYYKAKQLWAQLIQDPTKQVYIELESRTEHVGVLEAQVTELQIDLGIRIHNCVLLQRAVECWASEEHWQSLRGQYCKLQEEYRGYPDELKKSQEESAKHILKIKELEKKLGAYEANFDRGSRLYKSKQEECDELAKKNNSFRSQHRYLEEDYDDLKQLREKLQTRVEILEEETSQYENDLVAFGAHAFERLVKLHLLLLECGYNTRDREHDRLSGLAHVLLNLNEDDIIGRSQEPPKVDKDSIDEQNARD